jgi:bifunctional UDP-N-acetylglucosamine pyrophosphorylase/glucosamine-1-phosphate N-acetyltransferase
MIGILLAAGRGTRMKSETPKVLFSVNDEPMAFAPLHRLLTLCEKVIVVVGHAGEDVKAALWQRATEVFDEKTLHQRLQFVTQNPPKGTGDAVRTAFEALSEKNKNLKTNFLVLNGDLPLIRELTLKFFMDEFEKRKLNSACLSMVARNPMGLGRILRDKRGVFIGIREENDANDDEKKIIEVNSGVYLFTYNLLNDKLKNLKINSKKQEFYLTDLLGNHHDLNHSEAFLWRYPRDLAGVNTTFELAKARSVAQLRLQKTLSENFGVDFVDPRHCYISARSQFKGNCSVGPGTMILGKSEISKGVILEGNSYIKDSHLSENVQILWGSVVKESRVEKGAQIGPMAHLRPGTKIGEEAKIGNFVEIKNSTIAKKAKASHLSYLGDAEIGESTNIGCGTITCNYDGLNKNKTLIGKNTFIGSDTQLIAPVSVGDNAYIASGTTVTSNVPSGALVLSRAPMVIKEGYAKKLMAIKKKK